MPCERGHRLLVEKTPSSQCCGGMKAAEGYFEAPADTVDLLEDDDESDDAVLEAVEPEPGAEAAGAAEEAAGTELEVERESVR